MLMECLEAGPFATNGYVVCDREGGSAMAIDAPMDSAAAMIDQVARWQARLELVINTHGHFDHILDNATLIRQTGARLGIHREDERLLTIPQAKFFGLDIDMEPSRPDFYLAEGETLALGSLEFRLFHCPGHSPGSVVLFEPTEKVAFVGDVLFAGSIGRTDLPGGSMISLLRAIREKLFPLGDEVRVFPGHGPATTIGRERRTNPFLRDEPGAEG
jgi:glyoxylase-like metal-dependent hydrolase (beta-lactamase superfamily II)